MSVQNICQPVVVHARCQYGVVLTSHPTVLLFVRDGIARPHSHLEPKAVNKIL